MEGDAEASFGGYATRSKKGRGICASGGARMVSGSVKEMLSESVELCGGWERENRFLYRNWSRASTRKAGRAVEIVEDGRVADGS